MKEKKTIMKWIYDIILKSEIYILHAHKHVAFFFNIKQILTNKLVPFWMDNNQISYMVWSWPNILRIIHGQ